MNQKPKSLGFFMPPEWYDHSSTWISWPHNIETWLDLELIEKIYLDIIKSISTGEVVNILVNGKENEVNVKNKLSLSNIDLSQVKFYSIPTVDAWIRDYGPNFLINKNKELSFNNWIFNAWGSKYHELKKDNNVSDNINRFLNLKIFNPGIILEGGSIEVNGNGLCMTTEQCLLNQNRNSDLSKGEIEGYLKDFLGVDNVIWLKEGLKGDDTDGHIDDIARFVNSDTILINSPEQGDVNFNFMDENYKILEKFAEEFGLNIVKLPVPRSIQAKGQILPASYTNFYICNSSVLVPIFNDDNDSKAIDLIKRYFPERNVVGIDCRKLIEGFGAIHCITQQQPLP
tara:strand:+ start:10925 stop:11950 length:1026 start_codon:yes stop_codon:yes gene_type:complete